MPSKSKPKVEFPLQLVTESSKAEPIVITLDSESAKKEEASKPLYLKRI